MKSATYLPRVHQDNVRRKTNPTVTCPRARRIRPWSKL